MMEVTICVPAFNEESALAQTVEEIHAAATSAGVEFEILIVNDGSADRTGAIANEMACRYPRVVALHQPHNKGVGAAFKLALSHAKSDRITLIPGDNAYERRGLENLFRNIHVAELVITYRANMLSRPPQRRILSRVFSGWLRLLLNRCSLRDGHSLFVFPVTQARALEPLMPDDYRYHVVALVHLWREASTYAELPVDLRPRADKRSSVMRLPFLFRFTFTMVCLTVSALLDRSTKQPHPVLINVA